MTATCTAGLHHPGGVPEEDGREATFLHTRELRKLTLKESGGHSNRLHNARTTGMTLEMTAIRQAAFGERLQTLNNAWHR